VNLPTFETCPCCHTLNFVRVSEEVLNTKYKTLPNLNFKKKFSCRKCKEEIGLFVNNNNKKKLVWLNEIQLEENCFDRLKKLQTRKVRLNKDKSTKNLEQRENDILEEIGRIQNKLREDKIKLKIKLKIQKRTGIVI